MLEEKKRSVTVNRFTVEKHGLLTMHANTKEEKDTWVKLLKDLAILTIANGVIKSVGHRSSVIRASTRIFHDGLRKY